MIENNGFLLRGLAKVKAGGPADARRDYGPEQGRKACVRRTGVARGTRRMTVLMPAIHRRCGQHCGQDGRAEPQAANLLRVPFVAQTLSSKKSFKINDLHTHDTAMTGKSGSAANVGAVVEFLPRTHVEVARG
jgi:hypothetical protein